MIMTFFGHADFSKTEECEHRMLAFLEEKIGDRPAQMYLGGYGAFDSFAYDCCKKYKYTHPNISLVFVTPYLTAGYQKNHLEYQKTKYDAILYPDIEDKPAKLAIVYRNRYMVEKADCIVFYIHRDWGGAYHSYCLAKQKGKEIFNLAVF